MVTNTKDSVVNLFKSQIYVISVCLRQIIGTVVLFVLAHVFSVYEYGLFSSYNAIAIFCLMFANLGFNEYMLVTSKNNTRRANLKVAFWPITSILITILIIIFSLFFNMAFPLLFVLILLKQAFDGTYFVLLLTYFQSTKRYKIISWVNIIYSIGVILVTIFAYIHKISLVKFLLLIILLGIVNFAFISLYTKIKYVLAIKYYKKMFNNIDKSIISYMKVRFLYYLYSQIQGVYVALFLTKEEAALYFAAFTCASVINLFLVAQTQKIVPEMINISVAEVKNIIKKELLIVLLINSLVLFIFVFQGKFLLEFAYGHAEYQNAYWTLLLLSISNIPMIIALIYGAYITASENQHIKIKLHVYAIAVAIVSLFVFNNLGVYTAVISYFLSAMYIAVASVVKSKQLFKVNER